MGTKLLKNHQISPAIIDMIMSAKRRIVLVTPYIKLWGNLERELKSAVKRKVDVSLVFRKEKREEYTEVLEKLVSMGLRVYAVEHLHAKIYASESEAISTSMNLYEFSAQNSIEVGVKFTDTDLLDQIQGYVIDLTESNATDISKSIRSQKVIRGVGNVLKAGADLVVGAVVGEYPGACIRCGCDIEPNTARPLCPKCYKSWNKYGDDTYQEKYCHVCGNPSKTSVAKPVCYDCYKAGI